MQPKVAYWTSFFEADMEAVAGEVLALCRHFRRSAMWGLSARVPWQVVPGRRGWAMPPRWHLVLRAMARVVEGRFDLNHVFGTIGDWFYLVTKRRRPTVLTAALVNEPVGPDLLDRVDRFVVETRSGVAALGRHGICPSRVTVVPPGVDLDRFRPEPPPDGPFRVLFASSPDNADAMDARGVGILLEAARLLPDCRFDLLWRPWGKSLPAMRRRLAEAGLTNVHVSVGRVGDMRRAYADAHGTVAPFTRTGWFKPCPNSLIESLACGRPVVATDLVGIAAEVAEDGAGVVCEPNGRSLASAVERMRTNYDRCQSAARACAERRFALRDFLGAYEEIYDRVRRAGTARRTHHNAVRTGAPAPCASATS